MRLSLFFLILLFVSGLQAGNPTELTKRTALQPVGRWTSVFVPGEEARWQWRLTGGVAVPEGGGNLEWELVFWNGEKQNGKVEIPAGTEVTFGFVPKLRGWASLRVVLKDAAGKSLATEETMLCVGETPAKSGRNFRYGICGGLRSTGDDYSRSMELMDKLGVDIVRGEFYWDSLEPTPGEWRYEKYDRFLDDLKQRGMEMQAIVDYTAKWATTGDPKAKDYLDWARAMPQMEPWLEYVKKTVQRYKGVVRYWEIWNEPDISFWRDTTENYVRLFNQTTKTIREVNPDAVILNGGLALIPYDKNPKFREDFLAHADKTNWNIRAYHDYQTFLQMQERYAQHESLYRRSTLTQLPIWINEGGFHTLVPDGDRQQTIHLVKKLAAAPALPGVMSYIWYNLNDIKPEGNDPEHRFGVSDYFFRPKPAYGAYQNLLRELGSRKFLTNKMTASGMLGVWMQLYQGPDSHRLVIWQEGSKGLVPVALKWTGTKTQVTAVSDLMGNPLTLARLKGQTLVTIGDAPIYVILQGEAEYPMTERFLELPETLALLPGVKPEIELVVNNPTGDVLPVELTARMEGGTDPAVTSQVNLPAKESHRVVLEVPGLANHAAAKGYLKIEVCPIGAEGVLQAVIPYEKAIVLSHTREKGETDYHLEINKQTQVVNLYDVQGRSDQAWKGPEDLSALGTLSYDEHGLNVRVVVTDDRHVQSERAPLAWRGDSVQFAMRLASPGALALEFTLALPDKGGATGWVQSVPRGSSLTAGGVDAAVLPYQVEMTGNQTTYTMNIPWSAFGRQSWPSEGFRFNLLVNDNDGEGRRQWIEMAPGIGKQKDTSAFPLFICK